MIEVRGARIRLLRGGGGPPLFFLHGAGGHVGWLPFLERLSQNFDVLAPEHPGFGNSDDPAWLDRPSDLAYFYLDMIEALKLERVDGLVPVVFGDAYRKSIPFSKLVVIPAAGHAPFEEQPDTFLSAFGEFLSERGFWPHSDKSTDASRPNAGRST